MTLSHINLLSYLGRVTTLTGQRNATRRVYVHFGQMIHQGFYTHSLGKERNKWALKQNKKKKKPIMQMYYWFPNHNQREH